MCFITSIDGDALRAPLGHSGSTGWLGRQDSNLRMAASKPLPYHLATPQRARCERVYNARRMIGKVAA